MATYAVVTNLDVTNRYGDFTMRNLSQCGGQTFENQATIRQLKAQLSFKINDQASDVEKTTTYCKNEFTPHLSHFFFVFQFFFFNFFD